MSTNKQNKAQQNLLKQIEQPPKIDLKQQIQWLLRSLLVKDKSNLETGFVLPTVAMVSLVVVLLTVALVVRAFDRSKNASNVRVNQVVLNAATPALDRAKAKIDALFVDPTLPRTTPSDIALDIAIKSNPNRYKFGDETPLKLVKEFNGTAGIQKQPATTLEGDETINTAWKYPVDTDNNGTFDSYTLYGIYFRSPTRDANGKFNRQRNPLEVRTPPMSGGYLGSECKNVSSNTANLVGDSSWYKIGTKLTKSFYVYTATVPITEKPTNPSVGTSDNYEKYPGNKGFTALEYQQDRSQIPINNNAVVFQDDLELTPGTAFRLNGRVFTNANLLIGGRDGGAIRLFQVSSKNSCFYKEEDAKITVGGNVGTGNINDTTNQSSVAVDLYNGFGNDPVTNKVIDGSNKSTTSTGGAAVGYNDTAYNKRIAKMKESALSPYTPANPPTILTVEAVTKYPKEVKEGFKAKVNANSSLDKYTVLANEIEIYLKDRTRRVPYAEVGSVDTLETTATVFETGTIEPIAAWREPTDTNTGLSLSTSQLEQTDPDKQKKLGKEVLLGDRISVGNNLSLYWKNALGKYVTGIFERQFFKPPITPSEVFWTDPTDKTRFRTTQVAKLPDLGIAQRTGFWEDAAAQTPANTTSNTGGLRVVTGAGIYVDDDGSPTVGTAFYSRATFSFLRKPRLDIGADPLNPLVTAPPKFETASITTGNENIVTWTDTMPMTGGAAEIAGANQKGDLQMRATAIYHYKDDANYTDSTVGNGYIKRTPTACISSYYDPTNSVTARNTVGLPDLANLPNVTTASNEGRSNNGVVYPTPYKTDADRVTAIGTYRSRLNRQARLIFPNGRIVNEPLRNALKKIDDATLTRSLGDNSAIDTAICGIRILNGTLTPNAATVIIPLPHGAIKESSFLDARQAKALDRTPTAGGINPISPNELSASTTLGNYNLQLEQRQPLEIRVTDIDMETLRTKTIGGLPNQEYLLPNSGIIYATRDDALLDLSDTSTQKELLSPTDFKLDPTRRPNGIRLLNGSNLARVNTFRQEEKGLILVTNLPVYIRGDFNLHRSSGGTTREEFTDTLDSTWSNFYSRTAATLNADFACRINQTGCGSEGDQWRPATIISDATSLMSAGFIDGFRDWGDYDLNNNAGFSNIQNRLRNGFFENSFATSSLWWDTANTGNTPYPSGKSNTLPSMRYVSSYLTNGISPVQRRTDFPEYVMEICRKIPVSECNSNDWVVGFDLNGNGSLSDVVTAFDVDGDGIVGGLADTEEKIKANQVGQALVTSGKAAGADNILTTTLTPDEVQWSTQYQYPVSGGISKSPLERLGAGTTARVSLVTSDQRYARRVAFARNQINTLAFVTIGTGASAKNVVKPLGVGCPLDGLGTAPQKNGCQYPNSSNWTAGTHYGIPASNALWFRTTSSPDGSPAADIGYGNNRPLYYLPPNINSRKIMLPNTPEIPGVTTLNGTGTSNPSDFTMCVTSNGSGSGISQEYLVSSVSGACPINLKPQVDQLLGLTATGSLTGNTQTVTASAANNVNVYTLPSGNPTINNGATITLNGSSDSIFVFQGGDSVTFGSNTRGAGINLNLNGVNPNNIFWVSNGSLDINDATTAAPHKLAGNFIGKTALKIGENTQVFGGRFLNFTTDNTGIPGTSFIYAVTSEAQPELAPVLQVHSPGGTPAATLDTGGSILGSWIQQAGTATTFNAAFVTGNSPSRPTEESAGLHNFVRFMERWNNTTVNIKGSFIQLEKSAYATAPFSPLRSTGDAPITSSNNGNLSIFDYPSTLYPSGDGTNNTLTFYGAPERQWGFDVALLTQPPDLLAQKYSLQSTNAPDEFFRQVGQDDPWVQNLLCAAQGTASTYTDALGRPSSGQNARPSTCPALTDYAD